ncbi:hypothetical protein QUC32_23085 [Novosphingobium resinovorum]|uniref:hypothetical protein n=1 Tax=Novosphingobium TaxID=165696 RepID=UPI001B3CA434|nr:MULTISPECIES: hypothetical protein [Novosphingobium]MBF7012536.1 hypothetical protein [Novosphingobium sp. HR1a]WJM27270.1 hypothetical protein QUC32_23085 [Novosphingobium resinovorum]
MTAPKAKPAPAPEIPAAPEKPVTEVVHSETVLVDNTEVVEEEVAPPETKETDLGNGTIKVSYI